MSLEGPNKPYMNPPPASSQYAPPGNDPRRGPPPPPPPTLPSMSSLLNTQAPGPEHYQMAPGQRQFQPPYNMVKQWHPQVSSAPHPPQSYPQPPAPPVSYFSQTPIEPLPASAVRRYVEQHELAISAHQAQSLAQRRQTKKIKIRAEKGLKENPPQGPRFSSMQSRFYEQEANSPPHEQDPSAFRREPPSDQSSPQSNSQSQSQSQSQSSRTLSVSNLLSEESTSKAAQQPPPPPPPGPKYTLRMRQQPIAARACGFGERDRRVIDPPPILQMDVAHPTASPEELTRYIRSPYAVVHCTLWDPVNDRDDSSMPSTTDKRLQQRRLMGTLVASPFVGNDEFNNEGCFFTFPDLSVRTPGTYSLLFKLVVLNPLQMAPGSRNPIQSVVKTATFNVYNAKDFRGMRASTELTKALKHQGCLISVKKGNHKASDVIDNDNDRNDEDDDEDEDEEDGGDQPRPKGKRARR